MYIKLFQSNMGNMGVYTDKQGVVGAEPGQVVK